MINFIKTAPIIGGTDKDFGNFKFYENNTFELNGSIGSPTYRDITIAGQMSLTLLNAKADSLEYLKAFGGTEQKNLPNGYIQLEYLESTGTQYIETNLHATEDLSATYTVQVTNTAVPSMFFGARDSDSGSSDKSFISGVTTTSALLYAQFGSSLTTINTINADTNKHEYELSKDGWYVDGVEYRSFSSDAFTGVKTIKVFAGSNGNNTTYSYCRIYKLIFYKNNNIYRNFIPARRKSDNVLGMYDTVTDTFFTNAGTGEFIAGTEIVPLPAEYTQLLYIESNGTQWIDTGVKPNQNTKIVYLSYNNATTGGFETGSRIAYQDEMFCSMLYKTAFRGLYADNEYSEVSSAANTRHLIEMYGNGKFYLDNTLALEYTQTDIANNLNIFMFKFNNNGTATGGGMGRIYYYKIYDNNILIRNLIPAKNSSGTIGLYDTVNNTFYTNQGTGTFTAGAEIVPTPDNSIPLWCNNGELKVKNKSGLPLEYQALEYLECSGTQYIDTGVNPDINTDLDLGGVDFSQTSGSVRFGSRVAAGDSAFSLITTAQNEARFDYGNTVNNKFSFTGNYDRVTFDHTTRKAKAYRNGSLLETVSYEAQTINNPYNLLIFAHNSGGTISPANGCKVRYCKLWKSGVLVRNLIPCRRKSDNVLGMYDLVTETFFTNAGTDTFTAGADVDDTEIYSDGTQETISIHGKNLLNMASANIHSGFLGDNVGDPIVWKTSTVTSTIVGAINVKVGESYTFSSFNSISGELSICIVNNDILLQQIKYDIIANQRASGSITATANGQLYVQYVIAGQDFQLEQGSTATTYEPYYNGGIANCENLLSVSTYKDVQEVISGSVTRKIGIKVLTGNEDWSEQGSTSSASAFLYWSLLKTDLGTNSNVLPPSTSALLCTHYPIITNTSQSSTNKIIVGASYVNFITRSIYSTLADWKAFLQQQYTNGTPVIIVYPLATPTTETVTGQTMAIQGGTNIIEVTQSSIDNLKLEAQYKAGVGVTITEIQNVNLDNSVTVTIS